MIPTEVLRKIRQIEIRTRHIVSDVFAGQYHSVFKGQGMEFDEVREYAPGDEIRSIDWNVTARMGHPFIKKFTEERELTVMLLVDASASQQFGSTPQFKRDLSAELAAVLAFAAIRNNDRVGAILFTDRVEQFIPPRKGPRHVLRVVRDLLYHKPEGRGTRIASALDYLGRITHRKTVSFVISDFLDDGYARSLAVSARRHDLIAMMIGDDRERRWPAAGILEFEDAETGARQLVDLGDRRTREHFEREATRRRDATLDLLRRSGVDTVQITAGQPYVQELVKFFRMREQRMRT